MGCLQSMKTAALIAQDLVNNQQLLVPGYQLVSHFFDDERSTDRATQLLLEQRSANDNVVALAGLGCKASCRLLLPSHLQCGFRFSACLHRP